MNDFHFEQPKPRPESRGVVALDRAVEHGREQRTDCLVQELVAHERAKDFGKRAKRAGWHLLVVVVATAVLMPILAPAPIGFPLRWALSVVAFGTTIFCANRWLKLSRQAASARLASEEYRGLADQMAWLLAQYSFSGSAAAQLDFEVAVVKWRPEKVTADNRFKPTPLETANAKERLALYKLTEGL